MVQRRERGRFAVAVLALVACATGGCFDFDSLSDHFDEAVPVIAPDAAVMRGYQRYAPFEPDTPFTVTAGGSPLFAPFYDFVPDASFVDPGSQVSFDPAQAFDSDRSHGSARFELPQAPAGLNRALLAWTLPSSTVDQQWLRAWVRVSDQTSSVNVLTFVFLSESANPTRLRFALEADGTVDLHVPGLVSTVASGRILPKNTWVCVELDLTNFALGDGGNGPADMHLRLTAPTIEPIELSARANARGLADAIWIGVADEQADNPAASTVWIDEVAYDTAPLYCP
jgi:hypothetical protein